MSSLHGFSRVFGEEILAPGGDEALEFEAVFAGRLSRRIEGCALDYGEVGERFTF